jgi:anaphase-promoting complex subunit 3
VILAVLINNVIKQQAIQDLEILRDSSPEESNVVFQLAKVYRLVGDEVKSAQLLAIARDTSPKSVNKLKKLLETVKDDETEVDVSRDDQMDEG